MIQSAKEAREIITKHLNPNYDGRETRAEFLQARGYLDGLEGPEVKALVDFVGKCSCLVQPSTEDSRKGLLEWVIQRGDKILAQYREAVKPC